MEREMLFVDYYASERDESYPEKLSEFIKFISEKLEAIPEEYRESATIKTEEQLDYDGSAESWLLIQYQRPGNRPEMEQRIKCAKYTAERNAKRAMETIKKYKERYGELEE